MNNYNKFFSANKNNWNKRAELHYKSDFYNVSDFIKLKDSLNSIEKDELGNVNGKSILHLQCHFGQDTLSLANLGADATGVDFSEASIEKAKLLSEETGIESRFICSNVYELKNNLNEKFEVVFTSYGTIGWLPDIDGWAEIVSYYLKPGGEFLIVEFHPFLWMFDDNFNEIEYSYFHTGKPFEELAEHTYTDNVEKIDMIQYSWNHSLSDVINSLIKQGMRIESVNEFNYSPYNCFPGMKEIEKGKYIFKKFDNLIPIIYSIKAVKQD